MENGTGAGGGAACCGWRFSSVSGVLLLPPAATPGVFCFFSETFFSESGLFRAPLTAHSAHA